MKKMLITTIAVLGFYGLLAHPSMMAQDNPSPERRGWGYGFFSLGGESNRGGTTDMLHLGAGGEGLVYKGVGVGVELGYLTPLRAFRSGFGVLSTNGSYHFVRPQSKWAPFVTGGYSLGFREDTVNLVNFGGGVNYWMRDRVGLRLEFRDHVLSTEGYTSHFWGFRFGVTFR